MIVREPDVARFWSKVSKCSDSGCWEWSASRLVDGYGQFGLAGKVERAHRVAYSIAVGPIGEGLVVRHKCDNPPCCNPDHLEVGTVADNNRDRDVRGRTVTLSGDAHPLRARPWLAARGDRNGARTHPERLRRGANHPKVLRPETCVRGERNGRAKISDAEANELREAYAAGGVTYLALGARFGISNVQASNIVRMKSRCEVSL